MNKLIQCGALALTAALLAGCENDAASYQIDGKDHAITLIREQKYFWNDNTDLAAIPARLPECQRRHPLKSAPLPKAQVSVYELAPGQYYLQQDTRWYLTETMACTLRPVDGAPANPGLLLGKFDRKGDKLRFIPVPAQAPASGAPSN